MKKNINLPAEWAHQSGVQLTFPHSQTDWAPYLNEAVECFSKIAMAIASRQKLLIVTQDKSLAQRALTGCNMANVRFVETQTDDTWARDHGGITVFRDGIPVVLDFGFNGWGNKFDATLDNQITRQLFQSDVFETGVVYQNELHFILEGGSIESDGMGTLLTTKACLLSKNRNDSLGEAQIENYLKQILGVRKILWLENGFLEGDDTDSHIDTLARFCDQHTIAYVKCEDVADVHYDALKQMEMELKQFTAHDGSPYRLIPLPMAETVIENNERLPATYANFLIINGAVLMPTYNSPRDEIAGRALAVAFPNREIVGIDCSVLIRQHGSLHCVTMQYPDGVLRAF